MPINSAAYVLFFSIVLILFWISPSRARTMLLLLASGFFYACWDWRFLLLLILSASVDFAVGLRLGTPAAPTDSRERFRRLAWLRLSILTQLGTLAIFKYFNFFADSFHSLLAGLGIEAPLTHLGVALPLGISFYTLKSLSYTVDVYYARIAPTLSWPKYVLFVSFFPELVAGPIDRAKALLPQLSMAQRFTGARLADGANLLFLGLVKKVFIADNLGRLIAPAWALTDRHGMDALLPVYLYSAQIYCDFSGYTDMARGCGTCLGFDLARNFRFPYLAFSPSDFWQRWHISLSTWLRDYVFMPLGGAWKSTAQAYRNLLITMLACGLWHGASWIFVIWGAYQGVLLVAHRIMQPSLRRLRGRLRHRLHKHLRRGLEILLTFHLVCLGWLLFRSDTISGAYSALLRILHPHFLSDGSLLRAATPFLATLLMIDILQHILAREDVFREARLPLWSRAVLYSTLFYLLAFHGASAQSFIYATF